MSDSNKVAICPNCGFHAINNYCSECGQETHLHKETFWGLVSHFIGHYFHYDSKFWQTIKALWFSPGKLTIAYWNKQRMRYIPPVSLYIFISAVYFLLFLNTKHDGININNGNTSNVKVVYGSAHANDISFKNATAQKTDDFLGRKFKKINTKYGDASSFIKEKFNHNLPKLFFFMIPVLAMLLKLVFIKHKNLFFVDHAIFALHYHSFWFSLFIIDLFNYPSFVGSLLTLICFIMATCYMVAALHNVYKTSWVKAIANTIIVGVGYLFLLLIIFLADLLLIVVFA